MRAVILQNGPLNLNCNSFHSRALNSKIMRYNKCLTDLVFSVRTVNYGPLFFPFDLFYGGKMRAVIYSTTLELG